jgi:predicted  nucleic acid-binding Zn-ribbon protein
LPTRKLRAETVKREVTLVDKLVNFYQAQIDVEEAPQTLTSYTDLAHQLFVTGRTEEACATLLDGLMEMYRRKTKDARLVAELDRTLAGQYFREGTRDEIRAQIVGQLRERFGLIQEPNAKDLRAFIMVLVYLKEKEVAKTELETAVAFFPEDEGIRELQREVLDEIEPPPLTPAEAVERERIIALFKEMRIEYSRSKAQMDRSRRAASQAEAALKKIHKRRESAADEGKELRAALADLRPELEKFEFELQSLEEAKARIVANPDKLSYQELRGAMSEIAERIRDAESTAATSRSEAERLEAAIADNQDFVKNYKTIEAEARKAIASTAAEVPEAEAAFKEVSVRYEKMRKKHYDIVYKKKKK